MSKRRSISGVRQEEKGGENNFEGWLSVQTQELFVEYHKKNVPQHMRRMFKLKSYLLSNIYRCGKKCGIIKIKNKKGRKKKDQLLKSVTRAPTLSETCILKSRAA
jgi:hypothetical protein